ncbi:HNH endonuclease [Microbacterium sp. 77mftsu3.1]|nr:HNH endonuclease [Microbacterium sp. 77mftsu3.1]
MKPSPVPLVAAPVAETDQVLARAPFPALSMNRQMLRNLFCHYCMREATTRDHVVAKARHGVNSYFNLVPACGPCNSTRGSSPSGCSCEFCTRARWLFDMGHRRRR